MPKKNSFSLYCSLIAFSLCVDTYHSDSAKGALSNIFPVVHSFKFDLIYGRVRAGDGFGDGLTQCGYTEDPSSVGQDFVPFFNSSGVK